MLIRPTVHWAGWFDIFLHGHLYSYDGFQKQSAPSVRGTHYLVVDPLGLLIYLRCGVVFYDVLSWVVLCIYNLHGG